MRLSPFLLAVILAGCDPIRAWVISVYPMNYEAPEDGVPPMTSGVTAAYPQFDGLDASRAQVALDLQPVLKGLSEPTEMVFFPDSETQGLVLEKGGRLARFDLAQGTATTVTKLDVLTRSEQGLLGVALHPSFAQTGRLFLHASVTSGEDQVGEISAWTLSPGRDAIERQGTVLQVVQPYANHNAGQIHFGPDGMLYVGLGDGGWRDDPHGHGQRGDTLLGSMLRIDVDQSSPGKAYSIPADNPWVDADGVAPEAWAIGIRNPWKFSFSPDGRMVLADVGQNAWEEVNVVAAGDNLGWKIKEASHCGPGREQCDEPGLTEPIFEYPHSMGSSITGGYVITDPALPEVAHHYVFGDFVSGRLWAIPLPEAGTTGKVEAKALGKWPILPSTFGRSPGGVLYVADFGKGAVFRLAAAPGAPSPQL